MARLKIEELHHKPWIKKPINPEANALVLAAATFRENCICVATRSWGQSKERFIRGLFLPIVEKLVLLCVPCFQRGNSDHGIIWFVIGLMIE